MHKSSEFSASKWVKLPIFSSAKEMALLFSKLTAAALFPIGRVLSSDQITISSENFLKTYESLLKTLFEEKKLLKESILPLAIANQLNDFELIKVNKTKHILRIIRPVIQLKWHFFRFSPIDQSFRSNVFCQDSIFWGVEFSYPQLYQDFETKKIIQINSDYPNLSLWKIIRKWCRDISLATPIHIGNKQMNLTMRLGKDLFPIINEHPDFKNREFKVGKQK